MTVNKLIKALEKLRDTFGNVAVCANAQGMLDAHNGVYSIVDVREAEYHVVPLVDGDGFAEYKADGSERTKKCIVLGYYPLRDG